MDFTQETITWIINGVFAFFVVMGFLFGAARGVKKSALRFVFLAVIGAGMYFLAPIISAWLLNFDFSSLLNVTVDLGGTPHNFTTVNAFMTAFIESNDALQQFVTANPSFTTLIDQLPTIVTNLVVFILGFWALKILTWPMYAIASIGYNKRREDGEKPKRHRFAGAMIGLVQGVGIALITFMPIAGVSSILNVEGTGGSGTLLGTLVPQEVAGYFSVYEDSALGQIGGMGDFDNRMFDGLTTIKVKNEETGETITIKPRQEAQTGMEIANDIQRLIDMVEEIQTAVETGQPVVIDWDLIEEVVDKVFELNSLQLMLEQYAPYLVDEAVNNAEYGISDEIDAMPISEDVRNFLNEFVDGLDEATIAGFKSDVLAIVGVGRALDEHGILELVFEMSADQITEEEMGEQILAIFGTDYALSSDIMTSILTSNSVRTLMPAGINVALGYIEHFLNESRPVEDVVLITRIDVENIDWDLEAQSFTQIMFNLFAFVNAIDPFNMGDVDEFELITSIELSRLGEVVNIIRDTQLFGEIYSSLTEIILTMPEVVEAASPYVNLDELLTLLSRPSTDPEALDWVTEFNTIEQLLDLYILIEESDELDVAEIETIIANLDSSLLEFVIDGAVRAVFIEGFQENIGTMVEGEFVFTPEFAWLDKLSLKAISANAEFFANMIGFVVDVTQTGIENLTYEELQVLVDAVENIETNENLTQQEIDDFKLFFDELLHYMLNKVDANMTWTQDIRIEDFIHNIDTIVELFTFALAIEDDTIYTYTPEQINAFVAEIAELNTDLSPEMIAVLQGFYDEFMANDSPLFVPIDIASIDFAVEGNIIGELLTIYIDYENTGLLNETVAQNLVLDLQTSYIGDQLLTAFIEEMVQDEIAPLWISTVDMTWVADNDGLVIELLDLALWLQDNDLENISQAQIDALQTEVNNIPVEPKYTDFAIFMQDFINSLSA